MNLTKEASEKLQARLKHCFETLDPEVVQKAVDSAKICTGAFAILGITEEISTEIDVYLMTKAFDELETYAPEKMAKFPESLKIMVTAVGYSSRLRAIMQDPKKALAGTSFFKNGFIIPNPSSTPDLFSL